MVLRFASTGQIQDRLFPIHVECGYSVFGVHLRLHDLADHEGVLGLQCGHRDPEQREQVLDLSADYYLWLLFVAAS